MGRPKWYRRLSVGQVLLFCAAATLLVTAIALPVMHPVPKTMAQQFGRDDRLWTTEEVLVSVPKEKHSKEFVLLSPEISQYILDMFDIMAFYGDVGSPVASYTATSKLYTFQLQFVDGSALNLQFVGFSSFICAAIDPATGESLWQKHYWPYDGKPVSENPRLYYPDLFNAYDAYEALQTLYRQLERGEPLTLE